MTLWYVIVGGIMFLTLVVIPLRSRWYLGCGLGLLGAILGGATAFGAGWYYVKHYHVVPRPRHDMDFNGMETPIICLVFIPALSALVGFVLGLACAYLLDQRLQNQLPPKPDGIEL
jgi:hypothetical protein